MSYSLKLNTSKDYNHNAIMSLESQASERKNRLAALRNKRKPNTSEVSDEQATKKPTPEQYV